MKKPVLPYLILFAGIVISVLVLIKAFGKNEEVSTANLYEASFYEPLGEGRVQCGLCPNRCLLNPGQRSICKVRENIDGKLYSLVYGKPVAAAIDPIEKKPFYHFLPGSKAFSLGTAGCNLSCKYCQNWDISQRFPEDLQAKNMTPQQVVDQASASGSQVIAFTYNEPTVWYEYMLDIAKLAKQKGVRTVMVSNGYINPEPLKNLLPYLDAMKVDFKSFNEETYTQLISGKREAVMETIKIVAKSKTWLEIVYLVVPEYTDNIQEIEEMCQWVKENAGDSVPIHFSRFSPKYKLTNLPPTPEETVKKARRVCLEKGMKYVYTGNIEDEEGSATYCPETNRAVIKRQGFFVEENRLDSEGKAPDCSTIISGVWK
ncbi:MAG: AmmeMemoRadiSam system radical SAM enzyme [bacterium]|nr:AmmeMemoRadiSam system radical SAM enzyme [bacterium]